MASRNPTPLIVAITKLLREYNASLIGVQILKANDIMNKCTPPLHLTFEPLSADSRVTVVSLAIEEAYGQ